MTTPNVGAPEWASEQASPWVQHNKAIRIFDAFAAYAPIEDRDLNSPPASCNDGARYLVAASPSGDWAAHEGEMAIAVGTNAANGWYFATVETEGVELYVRDEDLKIRFTGTDWTQLADSIDSIDDLTDVDLTGLADGYVLKWDQSNGFFYPAAEASATGAVAKEISSGSYDLLAADVGKYLRLTNAGAKTIAVRADSVEALPANGEWHIRNVTGGDATLDEGTNVVINPPVDGSLVIPAGGTVTLKRVATDEFDLFGATNQLISA